jgi:hypothetical protein
MASYPAPNTQTGLFNPNDFPTTTEVLGGFSPTKILVTNNIGSVTASNTSADKIQFLDNVNADINTSLNSKQNTISDNDLSIAKTNGLQSALDSKAPINNPNFTGTTKADILQLDNDNTIQLQIGDVQDLKISHDSSTGTILNDEGDLNITNSSGDTRLTTSASGKKVFINSVDVISVLNGKQDTLTFNAPSDNNSNPSTSAQIKTALDAKQDILTFNAPSSDNSNPSTSAQIKTALDGKQDTLTFNAPSDNNSNPSTSAQIKTALDAKQDTLTFNAPSSDNSNPSTSAQIKTALDAKQDTLSSSTTAILGTVDINSHLVIGNDGNLKCESITNPEHSFGNETIKLQTAIDNNFRNNGSDNFSDTQVRYLLALQPEYGHVSIGANSNTENPSVTGLGNGKLCIGYGNTGNSGSAFADAAISIAGVTADNGAIQINCVGGGKKQDGMAIKAVSNTHHIINFLNTSNTNRGKINGINANTVAFSTSSDRRLKENIENMPSQIDNIMNLRPVSYNWIEDGANGVGFIAQEVHNIYPDFREPYEQNYCSGNENYDEDCPCDENGKNFYYGLDYGLFTPYIIKAFQEYKTSTDATIASLTQRIDMLESIV